MPFLVPLSAQTEMPPGHDWGPNQDALTLSPWAAAEVTRPRSAFAAAPPVCALEQGRRHGERRWRPKESTGGPGHDQALTGYPRRADLANMFRLRSASCVVIGTS